MITEQANGTVIHPAIYELSKFLGSRRDPELAKFLELWLKSWIDITSCETTLLKQTLENKGVTLQQAEEETDKDAAQQIGKALQENCVRRELKERDTRYDLSYSIVAFRTTKRPLLYDQSGKI